MNIWGSFSDAILPSISKNNGGPFKNIGHSAGALVVNSRYNLFVKEQNFIYMCVYIYILRERDGGDG
jgi:hypothetical protein